MPAVQVIFNPKGSTVRNNGGSMIYAGNVSATSPITNALGLTTVAYHPGHVGAAIPHALVQGDLTNKTASLHNCGRWKPYTATGSTYGTMTKNEYLITRAGQTNYLAGIATSLFDSGCSDFGSRHSINNQIRDRYHVLYQYSLAFGQAGALPGGTNTLTANYDDGTKVWSADHAVTTRAVTSNLIYRVASTSYTVKAYLVPND